MVDANDTKLARIVEARMRLRERFEAKMRATPGISDEVPMGTGPANRHGMPRLPPGQYETAAWPVLDLGQKPLIDRAAWQLVVAGDVERRTVLRWADFMALEQVDEVSDFHCVTTWSKFDVPWTGVRFADVVALAEPTERARYVLVHGYDGYTTNLPLEEALKSDVILAHSAYGKPLSTEHGGPVRMVAPQLYAWKGAKWISGIELLEQDQAGFWELRGYSNSAHPWRDDRYS